ncbi:MAG TPA: carbamoyltransferase N-terminal domain-containing protein, partial [Nitrososphaera sp.]|nr:carbamoyltransferase N-terminal domain-containing protein [Nitrososphaera sp.]
MKTLGIGISHDSGIVLVEDGKILFGINEERLDRIKLSSGFPVDSINYLKNKFNVKPSEIDAICIGGRFGMFIESHTKLGDLVKDLDSTSHRGFISKSQSLLAPIYRSKLGTFLFRTLGPYMYGDRIARTLKLIKEAGFTCPVIFYDHHLCHAASAVFSAPKNIFHGKSLVITSDAAGDGFSTG